MVQVWVLDMPLQIIDLFASEHHKGLTSMFALSAIIACLDLFTQLTKDI